MHLELAWFVLFIGSAIVHCTFGPAHELAAPSGTATVHFCSAVNFPTS